jgi:hypothetical protein
LSEPLLLLLRYSFPLLPTLKASQAASSEARAMVKGRLVLWEQLLEA